MKLALKFYIFEIFVSLTVYLGKVESFYFSKVDVCQSNKDLYNRRKSLLSLSSTDDFKNNLWSDKVDYVDLLAREEEPTSTTRPLPLFLLSGAFYPSGTSYIHVFEMKYRTMMFDCANSDEMFGYIHTDGRTGSIAKVGTMCKITDRQLLDDGRQFIAFEGVSRFKVRKIMKTLPYVLGEVDTDVTDIITTPEQEELASELEKKTYGGLKAYIRLVKALEPRRTFTISQAAKLVRPQKSISSSFDSSVSGTTSVSTIPTTPISLPFTSNLPSTMTEGQRRTSFSFAIANMIQMNQDKESQLILQTTDIIKRMTAQNDILTQACDLVATELLKKPDFSQDRINQIKSISYNANDVDDDVLPPDVVDVKENAEKDEWDISNIE